MWVAKLKFQDKTDLYTPRTEKYNVILYGYPLSFYKRKNQYEVIYCGMLQGDEENKKQFLKELKSDKRIKKISVQGDFIIVLAVNPITKKAVEIFYSPKIIHLKPDINNTDGYEYWEVGSWDKRELNKLIQASFDEHFSGTLLSIKEMPIKDIYVTRIAPDLTEKQKQAFELALNSGYYGFPRKTNLEKLAKKMGISRPTYEEHLRKAEAKILPSIRLGE